MFTLADREGTAKTRQFTAVKNPVLKFARTDQREFSFTVRTMDKWNRLPDIVKQAATQSAFNTRRKKWKE